MGAVLTPAAESNVVIPEAGDRRREHGSGVRTCRRGFPSAAAPGGQRTAGWRLRGLYGAELVFQDIQQTREIGAEVLSGPRATAFK